MSKPGKKGLVPELRFSDFKKRGAWEEKPIDQVAAIYKGKGIAKADVTPTGKLPCIRYGELYTRYGEVIDEVFSRTDVDPSELFFSKAGDVIIPASGETKEDIATAACVLHDGVALGSDLNILRAKANGTFLSYYINHSKKRAIANIAQGDAVVHLYPHQLNTLSLTLPKPDEQQKIAACLSSVDALLAAESVKLEALRAHKKGLMQQLFPAQGAKVPSLRFPGFKGEWGPRPLGSVCEMKAGASIKAADILDRPADGLYPCYGGNGLRGYTEAFTHAGMFSLIGRQGALCGNVTLADGKFHATEHALVVANKEDVELDTLWLYHVLVHANLNQYAIGQAQPGVSVESLAKVQIPFAESTDEQQVIARCLSSMDERIALQAERIKAMEEHKKGLMQGLFPPVN